MKKLILLSLLSILATGCFSENDETNPFIQSEAEKQVAANYRALVNQNIEDIESNSQKMEELDLGIQEAGALIIGNIVSISNNGREVDDLKEQINNLKSTSSHTVNFPSGACSDRFIKQIQLSPGTKLHNFTVSLGDISQGAFGMPVENSEDEDQNWIASLKIFIDSVIQFRGSFDFDGEDGDVENRNGLSFIINKFGQDGHQSVSLDESFEIANKPVLITFVVEYGVNETQDTFNYNIEGLRTIEERLALQHLFGQCVKFRGEQVFDDGPELITPYKTNRNLIVSFEEER